MDVVGFAIWTLVILAIATFGTLSAVKIGKEVFVGLYAVLTILASIIAVKLIQIGPFVVPAGIIAYSVTFVITDVADEIWGKDFGYKIVMTGLLATVSAIAILYLAVSWPPASFLGPKFQEEYARILGTVPRIFIASVTAYMVSQNHDVWAFHFWREKTGGKHLWLRNNASTIVSQFLDTVIFITVAFAGVVPTHVLLNMILGQYIFKVLIALFDTPFVYLSVRILEKHGFGRSAQASLS